MLTVNELVRTYGAEFLSCYGEQIPAYQKRALWHLRNCRTEALGWRVVQCAECGQTQYRYNSCRHRGCPQCEGSKDAAWLHARVGDLLPTHYFHIVFTIPHELNPLFLNNPRLCYGVLFKAVAKTLKAVSRRRLNAEIGFFSILHTWGQKLEFHPHIHCVVPGGGLRSDETWVPTSKKRWYFAPTKVLAEVFRGIFIKALKRQGAKLNFSGNLEQLFERAVQKHWVVHAEPPFGSAVAVLKYLSRYTRKVALTNSRLISVKNSNVTFAFKDYSKNCKQQSLTLTVTEFIRRFLQHVPPPGFTRIRHYGFLNSKGKKERLQKIANAILGLLPALIKHQPLATAFVVSCQHCGAIGSFSTIEIVHAKINSS